MKKPKRLIALTLAGCMLLATTGCGQKSEQGTSKETEGASKETVESGTSVEAITEEDELSWLNVGSLPLVEEGTEKTLKIYAKVNPTFTDAEEKWMYQFIERTMNINLELTTFTNDNKSEMLSLAFASGELPDIIIGSDFIPSDLLNYGANEGQLMDMAPYIEDYMPNVAAGFEKAPYIKAYSADHEGRIWSLGRWSDALDREAIPKMYVNYTWLEEAGAQVPTTLDELLIACEKIKAWDSEKLPLGGTWMYYNPSIMILNGFGYLTDDARGTTVCLRDGKTVLPFADRELYGEYLKYMNTLYEKEYIHPDFFTMSNDAMKAMFAAADVGYIQQSPSWYTSEAYSEYWGATPLTSEYQAKAQWPCGYSTSVGGVVITSACEEPELAAAFIDFWYSYENAVLANSGPERGEYPEEYFYEDFGADFGRVFNEETNTYVYPQMENNKEKYPSLGDYLTDQISLWIASSFGNGIKDDPSQNKTLAGEPDTSKYADPSELRFELGGVLHGNIAIQETLAKYVTTDVYPQHVYFDADTSTELSNMFVAIKEYAVQETAKFITGARPLTDDELNSYFDELDRLGAAEYVQAYADYYESVK